MILILECSQVSLIHYFNIVYILGYYRLVYVYKNLGFKLKSCSENSIDYVWISEFEYRTQHHMMLYKLLQKYQAYSNIEVVILYLNDIYIISIY